MESEDDRLKKQIFLKTEILDTGYDGQKFQDFLNSQKNEGFFIFYDNKNKKISKVAAILIYGV